MEVATGLLMGDGWIYNKEGTPGIRSDMISPNYLKHIDSIFGFFGNGVTFKKTAEESAKQVRERSFMGSDAKAENYSDIYAWHSMCHPDLEELSSWYREGEKVWPSNIEITPTVLKHWYCGDGVWNNRNSHNHISIAMSNELGNEQKVDNMFQSAGLPAPSNYNTGERRDGSISMGAVFTVEQSKELWEYMGKPLPDFEYKWPEEYK
jgi:hypothetical protein